MRKLHFCILALSISAAALAAVAAVAQTPDVAAIPSAPVGSGTAASGATLAVPAPSASDVLLGKVPAPSVPAQRKTEQAKIEIPSTFVDYGHAEAEYVMALPDAPASETIWADDPRGVPYLNDKPEYGALGERAHFTRVDIYTGDTFDVQITFLKASQPFLDGLTQEKMQKVLRDEYADFKMENLKESFSAGSQTLKWATITGYTSDRNNDLFYNAMHYISGLSSIMVIKIIYNVDNKTYDSWYKILSRSIRYTGR